MPISSRSPIVHTLLAQHQLTQAMVTRQVARSVVITFASGRQVRLGNATITQTLPGANGAGTIQITYQGGSAAPHTVTDDWNS